MQISSVHSSRDNKTRKYVQKTALGQLIEATYVNHGRKHIICFSSQIGCVIGCAFCASGKRNDAKRFRNSLSWEEIVAQCENVIVQERLRERTEPILFSAMGEGEPFLNLSNVLSALRALGAQYLNARAAISTSGIRPDLICDLASCALGIPLKLQISIHAPTDEKRKLLVRTSVPLQSIVEAGKQYEKTTGHKIEWNYVLMRGTNDSQRDAHLLAELLGENACIKLNQLNRVHGAFYIPPSKVRASNFKKWLEDYGLSAEYYETNGGDVGAACGQLTYHP